MKIWVVLKQLRRGVQPDRMILDECIAFIEPCARKRVPYDTYKGREGALGRMNIEVLDEVPDIALLDHWVGNGALFVGWLLVLFGQWFIGSFMMMFGAFCLFNLEPAQYLIETVRDGEIVNIRLYRPNMCKARVFKDDVVSGPYLGEELKQLKRDIYETGV